MQIYLHILVFNKCIQCTCVHAEAFFTDLMTKVYEYQNEGDIIICGDFNARCGDESDYIEGVDNVPPREVIDHKLNSYGQLLIDFLVDCNDKW